MRIPVRGEYALRALITLGETYDQGVIRIQEISDRQNIPKRFLEQILNDLRTGGFVESRRGVAGGYRLAHAPEEITLAALIGHIQGALPLTRLAGERRATPGRRNEESCAIESVLQEVRNTMHAVLQKITLADLCERARKFHGDAYNTPDYVI